MFNIVGKLITVAIIYTYSYIGSFRRLFNGFIHNTLDFGGTHSRSESRTADYISQYFNNVGDDIMLMIMTIPTTVVKIGWCW